MDMPRQFTIDKHRNRTRALEEELRFFTAGELNSMNRGLQFVIPSQQKLVEVRENVVAAMDEYRGVGKVCCVCELVSKEEDMKMQALSDDLIERMPRTLRLPQVIEIPDFTLRQYDASGIHPALSGIMLFRDGFVTGNGSITAQICCSCLEILMDDNNMLPPVTAIANGNCIEWLPEDEGLSSLSRTDEQAIALVSPCVALSTVTGGACKTIKSHHYVVKNAEGPVVEMLPRNVSSRVRIIMVGRLTSDQEAACKKRYEMNVPLCGRAVAFLTENNIEYRKRRGSWNFDDVQRYASTSVIVRRAETPQSSNSTNDVVDAIRDTTTYGNTGSAIGEGDMSSLETSWIATSSLILQPPTSCDDVVVRKSNYYVPFTKWQSSVHMFPTLFPGGCGGPCEKRARTLSTTKWIQRLLRIAERRLEQHYAFLLLAFDFLALQSARKAMYIELHANCFALAAGAISEKTIEQSIKYQTHLFESQSHGRKPDPPPRCLNAIVNLRKGLTTSESASYGSNLSKTRARHDRFGYLKRFGPLQLFLTVSPDSAGTYFIAEKTNRLSADVVNAANLQLLQNHADRKQVASDNPMECALYFEHVMIAIIEVILGWDQAANRQNVVGVFSESPERLVLLLRNSKQVICMVILSCGSMDFLLQRTR